MQLLKRNKTNFRSNKLTIRQTKKNYIIPHGGKNTIDTLFDFFNIARSNREYLKNAIYDGLGIYSLVNWRSPKHYTYNDSTKKIIEVDTSATYGADGLKTKQFYIEGSIQKSSVSHKEYVYLGTFLRTEIDYSDDIIELKCDVMKNRIDDNYIINFKWGVRTNLTFNKLVHVLDKMCEFITAKLHSTNWKNNNILLFGYSMGGNIAQHIALRLLKTKYKGYLYLLSLGIGGTLDTAAIKSRIEYGLAKRFISIAILNSNKKYHTKQLPAKYNLNTYILPDKNTKTIKTLVLHTNIVHGSTTNDDITYDIKGYYDFENFFTKIYYNKAMKNKLHELIYYRALLKILISGFN